jgi:hypothetical protein
MTYFVTPIHLEWNSILKSQFSKILVRIQVPIMFWTLKIHCEKWLYFGQKQWHICFDSQVVNLEPSLN